MIDSCGYLLVVHGSRDSRYEQELVKLMGFIKQQFQHLPTPTPKATPLIQTASLELAPQPLADAIANFALDCIAQNIKIVKVIPLFLLAGVHLRQDIPREVERAQKKLVLETKLEIKLMPHLGSYPDLITILDNQFKQMDAEEKILLSHGSCLTLVNRECEQLAARLSAKIAYWSVFPKIEDIVNKFAALGVKDIAVVPYFLFSGRIVREINAHIKHLQIKYNTTKIIAGKPIGATPELAQIIINNMKQL